MYMHVCISCATEERKSSVLRIREKASSFVSIFNCPLSGPSNTNRAIGRSRYSSGVFEFARGQKRNFSQICGDLIRAPPLYKAIALNRKSQPPSSRPSSPLQICFDAAILILILIRTSISFPVRFVDLDLDWSISFSSSFCRSRFGSPRADSRSRFVFRGVWCYRFDKSIRGGL